MSPSDLAFEHLKKNGLRLTEARRFLVSFILNQVGHWTIQDLVVRSRRWKRPVGQATLYRTVKLLESAGFLTETLLGLESARYEVKREEHHDHLTCLDCGEIVEFEDLAIEELQEKVARKLGFQLSDHRMELFGRCEKDPCEHRLKSSKS